MREGPFRRAWIYINSPLQPRAGELSAAPGPDGKPICEWLELRPFLTAPPTVTE